MNNQKDNQKTAFNSYGQDADYSSKSSMNKPSYEFANKKTEKLVTALYMVTDCMDSGDALKGKLRSCGVDLLSDMYKLSILSPVEKHASVTAVLATIKEIIAFVEISHTIGFVSEMNASILKKEFSLLVAELHSYQAENQSSSFGGILFENQKNSSFTLSENMFDVGEKVPQIAHVAHAQRTAIKDTKEMSHTKTPYGMSFKNTQLGSAPKFKGLASGSQNNGAEKDDRSIKILSLVKDKAGSGGISIKDISSAFTDRSEKTIQRELNALVAKGQLKKIGAKRWSRYLI